MKRKLSMFFAIYIAICAWSIPIQAQGTDVTDTYITNPSFEGAYEVFARPNTDRTIDKPEGWEVTYTNGDANDFGNVAESFTQDGVKWMAKSRNSYFIRQRWSTNSTIGLSQELKNLAPGTYELKAYISNHVESGKQSTAKIFVTVGSSTYEIFATASSSTSESWEEYTVKFSVYETANVTIGLSSFHTEGTFKNAYDDFSLVQYELDLDEAIVHLTALKTQAEELIGSKAQTAVMAALAEAISGVDGAVQEETSEAITAAILKLDQAITDVNTSIKAYSALEQALASANANKENYLDFPGYDAFVEAITTAQGIYDSASDDAAAIEKAVDDLVAAERECRLSQETPADYTWFLVNPDANDGNNGWTVTGPMNNPLSLESWTGTDPANPYFDGGDWSGTSWTTTLSQNINGLPAGNYTLKAVARASNDVTMKLIAKAGSSVETICPSVGNTGGQIWYDAKEGSTEKGVNNGSGYGWSMNSVTFDVLDGQTLTISFSAATAGHQQWFSVDQFELIYNSTTDIVEPTKPELELPEITATSVMPVTSGTYAVYHPDSKKLLSGAVLNDYGYIVDEETYSTNLDAYTWTVTVTEDGSLTLQQASSGLYLNASTTNTWSIVMGSLDADNASRWIPSKVEEGYNLSSSREPNTFIGVDNLTGDNISIFYDKGADKNPLFQFITLKDLLSPAIQEYEGAMTAYRTAKAVFERKQTLQNVIVNAGEIVSDHPADYTAETTEAYEYAVSDAKGIYLNEDATMDQVNEAIASVREALNTYVLSAIEVSDDQPVDISYLIFNGDFSTNDVSLWNGAVGTASGGIYEMFQKSNFDMNQLLAGLPTGYYDLKVQGFAREKGNDSGAAYNDGTENIVAFLYAKAGETITESKMQSLYSETETGTLNGYANSISEANAAFEAGKYSDNLVEFFLEEGENLNVGVLYKGEYVTNSWTAYDNFQLIYRGNTLATLVRKVEEAIARAEEVAEGHMQNTVAESLTGSINAAKEVVAAEEPSKEDLTAAKEDLESAIEIAEASIATYVKLNLAISKVSETSVADTEKVKAAVADALAVYDEKEADEEGIDKAIEALQKAINEAIVENAVDGDVTELMINPEIIQTADKTKAPEGWEDSTNSGTNGNFTKDSGTKEAPVNSFLEAWNADAATIVFDYNQTIRNIPNGIYTLSAYTFTESKTENSVLYANESTAPMQTNVNGDTFKNGERTSVLVTVTDGTLKIGVKTIGTLDGLWHGADDFKLTCQANLDDLKAELNDSIEAATTLKAEEAALIVKAEMNKLEAAIEQGNEAKDSESTEEVFEALTALKSALLAARTSIELCNELIPLFTEANELIAQYGEMIDPSTLQAVLDSSYDMYTNQTDETDNAAIAAAKAELEAALEQYKKEINTDGVNDINADDIKVYVDGSTIVVEADDYAIYSQHGIRIPENTSLVPGIYIVKVAGQTVKVAVK